MADAVEQYFRLAVDPDLDRYFAQFSANAVVEDEGHEHHGVDAIRRWRTSVPSVIYTVVDEVVQGADTVARASIAGDFPGSPVVLTFRFTFAGDGRIDRLTIRV